jgi:peptidase A4-like protein
VEAPVASRNTAAYFTLSLSDNGAGNGTAWSYSTKINDTGLSRSSAEWIAESPVTGGHFWPLTDFGSVMFSNATATPDGGSATDISGLSPDQLIMVTRNGVIRANPQNSLSDGSYTDTWFSS